MTSENKSTVQGATVLITGGTGTFGNAFLDRCLESGAAEVRIFSRDEKKQYDMAQRYRAHPNVKFYLGDIRDKITIDAAMWGVDFVFHAAAMKQVPSCERVPMEAIKTNITGSDNLLTSAIQKRVKKVVCLSTDKAVYPLLEIVVHNLMKKEVLSNASNYGICKEKKILAGSRNDHCVASGDFGHPFDNHGICPEDVRHYRWRSG